MSEILAKQMHNLLLLKAAVERGSINRAASDLRISQSAITRGIARLESALGCRLVERNAQGVFATDLGRLMLRHVDLAADQLTAATAMLKSAQRTRFRSLSCGGSPVAMEAFVPSVMNQLLARYPNMALYLQEGQSPVMLEKVYRGELDIAIGAGLDTSVLEGVMVEPLVDDVMGVFASVRHPLAGADGPQEMDRLLATERWVFPEPLWAYPRSKLDQVAMLSLPTAVRTHSSSALRWYVREGGFLTISTALMLQAELAAGEVVELKTDWDFPASRHVVYYRAAASPDRPVQAAVDLLKAAAAEGPWSYPPRPGAP